jgi:prevent-host-death family protein
MTKVSMPEAKERLDELLQSAKQGHEVVITEKDGSDILLVPMSQSSRAGFIGCMRGTIHMADDFDASLDDFKEYME